MQRFEYRRPFAFAQGDKGDFGEVCLAGLAPSFNYSRENESPDEEAKERRIETWLLVFLCVS